MFRENGQKGESRTGVGVGVGAWDVSLSCADAVLHEYVVAVGAV